MFGFSWRLLSSVLRQSLKLSKTKQLVFWEPLNLLSSDEIINHRNSSNSQNPSDIFEDILKIHKLSSVILYPQYKILKIRLEIEQLISRKFLIYYFWMKLQNTIEDSEISQNLPRIFQSRKQCSLQSLISTGKLVSRSIFKASTTNICRIMRI